MSIYLNDEYFDRQTDYTDTDYCMHRQIEGQADIWVDSYRKMTDRQIYGIYVFEYLSLNVYIGIKGARWINRQIGRQIVIQITGGKQIGGMDTQI